jgi:GNAT superfamily N-acetyltransferase
MIRQAIPNDIFHLIDMGEAFHREAGIAARDERLAFDRDSFAYTAALLMDAKLLLVMEDDTGTPVGMAAADGAPCWFNRNCVLGRELLWYVQPAHRKGKDSRHLLGALEDLAKARGIHLFDVVAEEGERSDALGRLYRRADYNPAERVFRKVL